jgi:hypothetical protein
MLSVNARKRFRYVPLLAAGLVVFLGLVFLGDLTGLLWNILPFGWAKLNPSVLGPTADWLVWGVSFLLLISPIVLAFARRRMRATPVVVLTSFAFPFLSLVIVSWSYYAGATLLVGSGFLAAYTLVSRSETLLGIAVRSAARLVCTVVFAFLTVVAAGAIVSVLLSEGGVIIALLWGYSAAVADPLGGVLAIDLEVFFLARPLLLGGFVTLAIAAFVVLFNEPFRGAASLLRRWLPGLEDTCLNSEPRTGARKTVLGELVPYLIVAGSMVLGVAIALYPYTAGRVDVTLGVDSGFYIENLRSMSKPADALRLLVDGRALFFMLLFLMKTVSGLSPEWVVRLAPAVLSVLLALSTFTLVREGTGRSWVASFAALLSVISAQTAIGMSAGIINNWFALSVAGFAFAFVMRSMRLHSIRAAIGSVVALSILLASYSFLWVVVIAELTLVLAATMIGFGGLERHEWKREVGILGGVLSGSIVVPAAFVFLAAPLTGHGLGSLDPLSWFAQGWYFVGAVDPNLLGSVLAVFEEAFYSAANRIDLPLLTFLSIFGLLDHMSETRSFGKIISASILVPAALMVIISSSSTSPYVPMWLTWRGLYVMPIYITGALGVESVIRRVNGQESPWHSSGRLAFAGTFVGYVFVSHLGYLLRALELLIMIGGSSFG